MRINISDLTARILDSIDDVLDTENNPYALIFDEFWAGDRSGPATDSELVLLAYDILFNDPTPEDL
jgi:hypothetical protein